MEILINIGVIIAVILLFNLVIFVHELGHFLAAKWRGMVADRFQIWFGKPIWKKTIGGVQYGIGWIPAGGFVSLPQMATMEGIEGEVDDKAKANLKPAKPLDRIIVAFAGPLFSFGLAVLFALIVWAVGKPANKLTSTTVGYIGKDAPAQGVLQRGDEILEVEGNKVTHWFGGNTFKSIIANIYLSEGETVEFKVLRDGKELDLSSPFIIPETHFLKRKGMRYVGISPQSQLLVASTLENSPARVAGLEKGDEITHVNGVKMYSYAQFSELVKAGGNIEVSVLRDGVEMTKSLELKKPIKWDEYAVGVAWDSFSEANKFVDNELRHPNPIEQVVEHVGMMWTTITKVISPDTDINVGHMQSPIGIGMTYFDILKSPKGIYLMLSFTVLLNVNLAILNMLPLPVLDGGHITTSFYEMIRRKPIPTKVMLVLQNTFVLLLMGFMLFVATKDVFERALTGESSEGKERPAMKFSPLTESKQKEE